MAVSINISENNQVTIQQSAPSSLRFTNAAAASVNVARAQAHSVSLSNIKPIAVTVNNRGVSTSSGGGAWGEITGTITNQTDLINYLNEAKQTFDMESEDGSLFTIAVTNAGVLIVIPEGSTEPVITSPPVITGNEKVWYTLGSIAGSVTGSPTPERTFQWQRSPTGLNWTDITGATSATYTLVADDAGQRIRVVQTETNVLDSVSAFSDPTQAIEASIFNDTQWQNITPVTWGALTTQNWN